MIASVTADWLIDSDCAAPETVPSSATAMKYCSCRRVNAMAQQLAQAAAIATVPRREPGRPDEAQQLRDDQCPAAPYMLAIERRVRRLPFGGVSLLIAQKRNPKIEAHGGYMLRDDETFAIVFGQRPATTSAASLDDVEGGAACATPTEPSRVASSANPDEHGS